MAPVLKMRPTDSQAPNQEEHLPGQHSGPCGPADRTPKTTQLRTPGRRSPCRTPLHLQVAPGDTARAPACQSALEPSS